MDLLISYLKQPSTATGIVKLLSSCGLATSPDLVSQAIAFILAVAGIYDTFRNEKPAV